MIAAMRTIVLAAFASGCAVSVDIIHKLSGPEGGSRGGAAAFGTGRIDRAREVRVHPSEGILCRDIETPHVRTSSVDTRVTNPNGYRLATQFLTALEGGITGVYVFGNEYTCQRDGTCDRQREKYLYMIPLFADIAWGIYRSFTIHNEIKRTSEVEFGGTLAAGLEATAQETACPVDTELALYADTETLILHVGERGRVVEAELDLLYRFVVRNPSFSVGTNIQFDATNVAAFVAFARAKTAPVIAATPREPARAVEVETTITVPPPAPIPASVCIDTPYADACIRARPVRSQRMR